MFCCFHMLFIHLRERGSLTATTIMSTQPLGNHVHSFLVCTHASIISMLSAKHLVTVRESGHPLQTPYRSHWRWLAIGSRLHVTPISLRRTLAAIHRVESRKRSFLHRAASTVSVRHGGATSSCNAICSERLASFALPAVCRLGHAMPVACPRKTGDMQEPGCRVFCTPTLA